MKKNVSSFLLEFFTFYMTRSSLTISWGKIAWTVLLLSWFIRQQEVTYAQIINTWNCWISCSNMLKVSLPCYQMIFQLWNIIKTQKSASYLCISLNCVLFLMVWHLQKSFLFATEFILSKIYVWATDGDTTFIDCLQIKVASYSFICVSCKVILCTFHFLTAVPG